MKGLLPLGPFFMVAALMRPLSLQFCFSRQCISGDLANTSKKRAGAYVHGRKGDEGKDRMVGRGF